MADRPRKTLGLPSRDKRFGSQSAAPGGQCGGTTRQKPAAAPCRRRAGPRPEAKRRTRCAVPAAARRQPAEAVGPASSAAPGGVRISKLMAERGLCSRRDADEYIARGWVFVDGKRVSELGTRADPGAVITLDRQAQANQQSRMTILLHKPMGYVSGQPEPGFTPAVTLIQPKRSTARRTRRFSIRPA
jgi:23S rRNA pseudouridine2604 synthase